MSPKSATVRRRASRATALLLVAGLILSSPGCAFATLTGFVTGAITGAVDAPAQIYRINRGTLDRHPEYWPFNLVVFFPLGFMGGPIAGLAKGIAIDVQFWFLDGQVSYRKVFTSYREESIWRPYTIHW